MPHALNFDDIWISLLDLEPCLQKLTYIIDDTIRIKQVDSILVISPHMAVPYIEKFITNKYRDDVIPIYINGIFENDIDVACDSILKQFSYHSNTPLTLKNKNAEKLEMLSNMLDGNNNYLKTLCLFMENFEIYTAEKYHKLLYLLIDSCHSRSTSLLIVGFSTHINCFESLEKRIKSRFGSNQLLVKPIQDFDTFYKVVLKFLSPLNSELLESPKFRMELQNIYAYTSDIELIRNILTDYYMNISKPPHQKSINYSIYTSMSNQIPHEFHKIKDLTYLELCMLYSALLLFNKSDSDVPCLNFDACLKELNRTTEIRNVFKNVPDSIFQQAFKRLIQWEFIKPLCQNYTGGIQKDHSNKSSIIQPETTLGAHNTFYSSSNNNNNNVFTAYENLSSPYMGIDPMFHYLPYTTNMQYKLKYFIDNLDKLYDFQSLPTQIRAWIKREI